VFSHHGIESARQLFEAIRSRGICYHCGVRLALYIYFSARYRRPCSGEADFSFDLLRRRRCNVRACRSVRGRRLAKCTFRRTQTKGYEQLNDNAKMLAGHSNAAACGSVFGRRLTLTSSSRMTTTKGTSMESNASVVHLSHLQIDPCSIRADSSSVDTVRNI